MELDLKLLKEICKRYDAEVVENVAGGFQFSNKEMKISNKETKKVVDKMVKCRHTFQRIFFEKVSPEQILEEIKKKEMILKDLKEKYPNLLFKFLDNKGMVYHLVIKRKNQNEDNIFFNDIYNIIYKYITDEENNELVINYDILDEINGEKK